MTFILAYLIILNFLSNEMSHGNSTENQIQFIHSFVHTSNYFESFDFFFNKYLQLNSTWTAEKWYEFYCIQSILLYLLTHIWYCTLWPLHKRQKKNEEHAIDSASRTEFNSCKNINKQNCCVFLVSFRWRAKALRVMCAYMWLFILNTMWL